MEEKNLSIQYFMMKLEEKISSYAPVEISVGK
jgi:hypothetical protein